MSTAAVDTSSQRRVDRASNDGLSVTAYRGDGMVLLAFDLDQNLTANLAGFGVQRKSPQGETSPLLNRLSFTSTVTADTTPEQRTFTASTEAPFQKFRWLDVPPEIVPGAYTYTVSAMYFQPGQPLHTGSTVELVLDSLGGPQFPAFELGFTRGYLSSQAYRDKFNNAEIRAMPKTLDYDTAPYAPQYAWLGWDARRMIFAFLDECLNDPAVTVDAFTYDLDEPDFVAGLEKLGKRLRLVQDNASLHTGTALEPIAADRIEKAGASVSLTHFRRFSHDKVLIKKDAGGTPIKVLTGSANFSVRGLYVQANNVMVISNPGVAQHYEEAFEQALTDPAGFAKQPIAQQWFDFQGSGLPVASVCFSPHADASLSLGRVADAIKQASRSVFFAIMELGGSGEVFDEIKQLAARDQVFTYGITQAENAETLGLFKPGAANASVVDFAFLDKQVPEPFRQEWRGGAGQVIHHKFVVVDFNGDHPVVFAGSSNLAAGGEQSNGDNLLAISDPAVATAFGVEAIRLFDHYHFRDAMRAATEAAPLKLQAAGDPGPSWWQPYYDPADIKYRDRLLFGGAAPAGG